MCSHSTYAIANTSIIAVPGTHITTAERDIREPRYSIVSKGLSADLVVSLLSAYF